MMGKPVEKHFLAIALTAIFIAGASPAQAIVIDFDLSGPDGAVIPVGTFDTLGVRFDQPLVVDTGNSGLAPGSGPNAVRSGNPADAYGDITGFFLGPNTRTASLTASGADAPVGRSCRRVP